MKKNTIWRHQKKVAQMSTNSSGPFAVWKNNAKLRRNFLNRRINVKMEKMIIIRERGKMCRMLD